MSCYRPHLPSGYSGPLAQWARSVVHQSKPVEVSSDVTIDATSEADATTIATVEKRNAQNAGIAWLIEFSCAAAVPPAFPDALHVVLFESVDDGDMAAVCELARLALVGTPGTPGDQPTAPLYGRCRRVPDGGVRTAWEVRGWVDGDTATLKAGDGFAPITVTCSTTISCT